MRRRRRLLLTLAAVQAVVAVFLALGVNLATTSLPPLSGRQSLIAWVLVGTLTAASALCAIVAARAEGAPESARNGSIRKVAGVHAERDLILRGRGHIVAGHDQSSSIREGRHTFGEDTQDEENPRER